MKESAADFPLAGQAHRRYDPLRDAWVLVSAGRSARPWSGQLEPEPEAVMAAYDPECYLCPGNVRASGDINPAYAGPFVFTNDFAALRPDADTQHWNDGLLTAQGEAGTCRVVCFSPRHDLSLGAMSATEIRAVVDTLAEQTTELSTTYRHVQVFENRGQAMGASNWHPHGQIWAGSAIPQEHVRERATQLSYRERTGRRLLRDYEAQERDAERAIVQTEHWTIAVPFWAAWPFETIVLPRFDAKHLPDVGDAQRDDLAEALVELLSAYDALFGVPFPYSMGWHQDLNVRPGSGPEADDGWQLHGHFYPPLLRSSTVRKFMVGYELLAEAQRDLTPEAAASRLRRSRTAGR